MENKINEFKKLLLEDKEGKDFNKKFLESKDCISLTFGGKETHNFYLAYRTNYTSLMLHNHTRELIKLDEEDLEYFKNKYFNKLEEEMNEKINKIKVEYGRQ
jgi:hypothetical protein